MADRDDHRVIGRVIKPHGIRGEVVVESLSDVPGRFDPGVVVALGDDLHTIASSRPHAGRLLVAFEGLSDRNAAETLRGRSVTAGSRELDDQDVYYVHELVGLDVVTADGQWMGEVAGVRDLPAAAGYDLLEVDRDGVLWLLPSDDGLVEVATNADTGEDLLLVVDPPAGLLPDDADAAVEPDPAGQGVVDGEDPASGPDAS